MDKGRIRGRFNEVVRHVVEETLKALLDTPMRAT
jgi:hypothetical protein